MNTEETYPWNPCQSCTGKHFKLHNYQETEFDNFPTFNTYANENANVDTRKLLFPSELDLIHLVYLEYALQLVDGCMHKCRERRDSEVNGGSGYDLLLKECCEFMDKCGWTLLEKYCQEGQDAAAFYNTNSNQLVIVHRGTNNWATLMADKNEVVAQVKGPFGNRAYAYTKRIVEKYGASAVSITVTGHSLGGWLAVLATFYMTYPQYRDIDMKALDQPYEDYVRVYSYFDNTNPHLVAKNNDNESHHLHCVSFDGPGCKEVLAKIFPHYMNDRNFVERILRSTDVTVYLCPQNIVNLLWKQIGSVFKMESDEIFKDKVPLAENQSTFKWIAGKLSEVKDKVTFHDARAQIMAKSHESAKILKFWQEYEKQEHVGESFVKKVTDGVVGESIPHLLWKAPQKEPSNFQRRNPLELRTSCFNEVERSCIDWLHDLKMKHYKESSTTWVEKYERFDAIKYLTSDYKTEHEFQIIKPRPPAHLELDEICMSSDTELFRDYFIRKMKAAVRAYLMLGIGATIPDHFEALYMTRTCEYEKTLPQLGSEEIRDLELLKNAFQQDSVRNSCVILVQTPSGSANTHVCTAKIFQLLRNQGLEDPKAYFVLSSSLLLKLIEILNCEDAILQYLKYAVIECVSPYDVGLVKAWADKLQPRRHKGKEIRTNIAIVFSFDFSLFQLTSSTDRSTHQFIKHEIGEAAIQSLYEQADMRSLVQNLFTDFKIEGNRMRLTDLVPYTSENEEFYECLKLKKSELYPLLKRKSFGALLPDLSSLEKLYLQERTYRDVVVVGYSQDELMVFVRGDDDDCEGSSSRDCVNTFIRIEHKNLEGTLHETNAPADVMTYYRHRVILIPKFDQSWSDALREYNGHVVQPRVFVAPDGSKEHKMIWKGSFGKPDMTRLKLATLGEYECHQLIPDARSRLRIIADDPGIGKTTITKLLGIMSQEFRGNDRTYSWTIFIDVTKIVKQLDSLSKKSMNVKAIVQILAEIEAGEDGEGREIFERLLGHMVQQECKVRIFFDGLDEINERLKTVVLEAIMTLIADSRVGILMAGRVRLRKELEEKFRVPCYKLNPLSHEQRVDMLIKYWTTHPDFRPPGIGIMNKERRREVLKAYVEIFLKEFEKGVGSDVGRFLGVPFQLRMVADAYNKEFVKFYEEYINADVDELPSEAKLLEQDVLPRFTSLIELYQAFTWTKIREACQTKLGVDTNLKTGSEYNTQKRDAEKLFVAHMIAGFDNMFCAAERKKISSLSLACLDAPTGNLNLEVLQSRNCILVHTHENAIITGLHLCGIFKNYNPNTEDAQADTSDLVHSTVAEYLAAEFIFYQFLAPNPAYKDKLKHFLDSYLFLPRYENVHYFLNMLSMSHKDTAPIFKTPDVFTESSDLVTYFDAGKVEVDLMGRNILHYVFMHSKLRLNEACGFCGRAKSNCYLMKAKHLYEAEDMFGATPLGYVLSNPTFASFHFHYTHYSWIEEKIISLKCLLKLEKAFPDSGVDLIPIEADVCRCEHELAGLAAFATENVKYFNNYSIQLRGNFIEPNWQKYYIEEFYEKLPIKFALDLDGESRMRWLLRACDYNRLNPSYSRFEECLFAHVRASNYVHYRKAIKSLADHEELYLLQLFLKKDENKNKLMGTMYQIWEETEFFSIRNALSHGLSLDDSQMPRMGWVFFRLIWAKEYGEDDTIYANAILLWAEELSTKAITAERRTFQRKWTVEKREDLTWVWSNLLSLPLVRHILKDTAFDSFVTKYMGLIASGLTHIGTETPWFPKKALKTLETLESVKSGRDLLANKAEFAPLLQGSYNQSFRRPGKSWSWEEVKDAIRKDMSSCDSKRASQEEESMIDLWWEKFCPLDHLH